MGRPVVPPVEFAIILNEGCTQPVGQKESSRALSEEEALLLYPANN